MNTWRLHSKMLDIRWTRNLIRIALLLMLSIIGQAYAVTSSPIAVDSQLSVKYSGLVPNRTTNTFDSLATLTNISATNIDAPLSLVITSISNNAVTLANATGTSTDGKPYLDISVPGGSLAPTQSIKNLLLKFNNPGNTSFSFKASILQSSLQTAGQQVTVQVIAADPYNPALNLHYSWRVSEGSISNIDAATTTWTIPKGPGVHFANVQVSNRLGGYTERRIAVFSDNLGIPATVAPVKDFSQPAVSSSAMQYTETEFVVAADPNYLPSEVYNFKRAVYLPDLTVPYTDEFSNVNFQSTSDLSGRLNFWDSGHVICCSGEFGGHPHTHVYTDQSYIVGSAHLQDGSICGTDNKFQKSQATARAVLLDVNQQVLGNPVRVNNFGDYALPWNPLAWYVKLQCESHLPVVVSIDKVSSIADPAVFNNAGQPVVSTITASIGGQILGSDKALFLPPDSGQPSSNFPRSDLFLAFKGIDNQQSACAYYKTIGAVSSCDAAGNPTGAITFEDWKHKVGLGIYAHSGAQEYTATYINRIDLNLTRNHHAITYVNNGGNGTAAYVCNHLGPKTDAQVDIDAAIDNAINGKNLVACVAMDYGYELASGVPYVRYFTFAANGQLLLSINLDGRREKHMPGTCVACHGGDKYDGQFLTDSRTTPDFGGHFLPYDVGNFAFSTKAGYTKADQENAIYHLNKIAQTTNLTSIESNLIDAWYQAGPVTDENYWPQDWKDGVGTIPGVDVEQLYKKVNARYCRTCHVAMTPGQRSTNNPEEFFNWTVKDENFMQVICGHSATVQRNHTMPNSLVTFNRMWSDPAAVLLIKQWSGDNNCLTNPDPKLN